MLENIRPNVLKYIFSYFKELWEYGIRVVPSEQDSSVLPARVANHSAGFDSSCPLPELADRDFFLWDLWPKGEARGS